jgi:hypothetical protein
MITVKTSMFVIQYVPIWGSIIAPTEKDNVLHQRWHFKWHSCDKQEEIGSEEELPLLRRQPENSRKGLWMWQE